jgi:filamentous hemagglutinin
MSPLCAAHKTDDIMQQFDRRVRQSSLYNYTPQMGRPYLIETRPLFKNLNLFFGSDYFLSRMIPFADKTHYQKRYGDAFVENRMIRQQVLDKSGERFLKGYKSDKVMIKALFDNALEAAQELNLSPGIQLSGEHIDRLRKDIVWMEERVVDGQTVLVPQLYLAKLTRENIDPEGGKILGSDVTLNVENLDNTDLIRGTNTTDIRVKNNMNNYGGHIDGGKTSVDVGGRLHAVSSLIEGDETFIHAGELFSEREIHRNTYAHGYHDHLGDATVFRARKKDLSVIADDVFHAQSTDFESGQNQYLLSGGDMFLTGSALDADLSLKDAHYSYHRFDRTHSKTTSTAGGKVVMRSERDMVHAGLTIKAGKEIDVHAKGQKHSVALHDIHEEETHYEQKSGHGLSKKSSKSHRESSSVLANANSYEAGGDVRLTSDGHNTQEGSEITSGGDVTIKSTDGKVHMKGAKSSQSQSYKATFSDSTWVSTKDEGHVYESIQLPQISAKGTIVIEGGQGITVDIARSLDELAQNPATAWVGELRNNPDIDWQQVALIHEEWKNNTSHMSPQFQALVSVVVAIAMSWTGIGGPLLATLVSQASVSLINNKGDVGKVFKDMTHTQVLKDFAKSYVTAEVGGAIGGATGLGEASGSGGAPSGVQPTAWQHLGQAGINAVVRTTVKTIFDGGKVFHTFRDELKTASIEAGAKIVANQIGGMRNDGLDPVTHKVLHAGAGALKAKLDGEDVVAGAIGAAVGETVGEAVLAGTGDKELAALSGRLAAVTTAFVSGRDVNTADDTATIAVENNLAWLVPPLIWAGRAAVAFLPEAIELGRETETGKELEQQAKDWTVENTGLSEEKVEQGFEAGFLLAANANLAKSGAKQVGKGAAKVGEKLTGLVKGGSKKSSAPKTNKPDIQLVKETKKGKLENKPKNGKDNNVQTLSDGRMYGSHEGLVRKKAKDSHHVIQDAAVKDIKGYDRKKAPTIQLKGPSIKKDTEHYRATVEQRRQGGGTYNLERIRGYRALRKAGVSKNDAKNQIQIADEYFSELGVNKKTTTRIPRNRKIK